MYSKGANMRCHQLIRAKENIDGEWGLKGKAIGKTQKIENYYVIYFHRNIENRKLLHNLLTDFS